LRRRSGHHAVSHRARGVDNIIMAAAVGRADRAAAASTETILAGANSRESYFEQGEAPLALQS